ncbi:MAG: hypothetical protein ACRDSL_20510 [Pseudonocardiaceae bacterium]
MGVAVELTDASTALQRASRVKIPTGEAPSRVGRYWIDLVGWGSPRGAPGPGCPVRGARRNHW